MEAIVSIIIPAYNAIKYIERTLSSITQQTYRNLEILVIDDGSTDRTAEFVRHIAAQDSRIRLIQQANAGVAAARNHGIKEAQGEYLGFIDADDMWHPDAISRMVAQLTTTSSAETGMAYMWTVDVDEDDYLTGGVRVARYYGNIYPALLTCNFIGHGSACLMRRHCIDTVGDFKSSFLHQDAQGCEDWDMYLRIAHRYQVELVPDLLVAYRRCSGSMSFHSQRMDRSRQLAFDYLEKAFPSVHRKTKKWADSLDNRFLCRQSLKSGQTRAAWKQLWKAITLDPAMSLTTLVTWKLFVHLLRATILPSKRPTRRPESADLSINGKPAHAAHHPPQPARLPSRFKRISTYAAIACSYILPSNWIETLRVRWLSTQVCPDRPQPQQLSPFRAIELSAFAKLSAQAPSYRVTYGDESLVSPAPNFADAFHHR